MRFKNLLRLFFVPLLIGIGCASFSLPFLSQTTHALDICTDPAFSNLPDDIKKANGCPGGADLPKLADTVQTIIQNIILFVGVVAVIFIVVGGIQYMTSSGDSNKLQKAKNTILYSCIGLAICALAFIAVNFVIDNLLGTGNVNKVGDGTNTLEDSVQAIINGVILVLGFVCVAVVLMGGIQYMTSAGDASKAQKARTTIYSGLIGLAICVLSYGIVSYVTTEIIGASGATVTDVGGGDTILSTVQAILNGIIAVMGFVCVGVVVYGAINFMTSGGDSSKVQKARNCMIYGAIGLIICVLSFAIVSFVINYVIGGTGSGGGPAITTATDCANAGGTWTGTSCEGI